MSDKQLNNLWIFETFSIFSANQSNYSNKQYLKDNKINEIKAIIKILSPIWIKFGLLKIKKSVINPRGKFNPLTKSRTNF